MRIRYESGYLEHVCFFFKLAHVALFVDFTSFPGHCLFSTLQASQHVLLSGMCLESVFPLLRRNSATKETGNGFGWSEKRVRWEAKEIGASVRLFAPHWWKSPKKRRRTTRSESVSNMFRFCVLFQTYHFRISKKNKFSGWSKSILHQEGDTASEETTREIARALGRDRLNQGSRTRSSSREEPELRKAKGYIFKVWTTVLDFSNFSDRNFGSFFIFDFQTSPSFPESGSSSAPPPRSKDATIRSQRKELRDYKKKVEELCRLFHKRNTVQERNPHVLATVQSLTFFFFESSWYICRYIFCRQMYCRSWGVGVIVSLSLRDRLILSACQFIECGHRSSGSKLCPRMTIKALREDREMLQGKLADRDEITTPSSYPALPQHILDLLSYQTLSIW